MFEQTNRVQRAFLLLFVFVFLSVLFPYLPGHEGDNQFWADWSWHIRVHGLRNAYGSGTNYLPLYQWIMWLYGKLVVNPDHIGLRIGYLRCFTLAFDFAGLWFAWKWMDRRVDPLFFLLFNLLNIAYAYNTVIWGQVDGIMTTLVLISLYYAHKQKVIVSSIFVLLAINMKLQAIIFLPVWGLLLLFALLHTRKWLSVLYALLAMAAVQTLILLPFLLQKDALAQVWNVVTHSVDMYPRVSMNAYNFWYWISQKNPWDIVDSTPLLGPFSYKSIGLLLFCLGGLIALWPLLRTVYKKIKGENATISKRSVWLGCALVSLLFFFVNTQMHERYCHPAFIFIALWCFDTGKYGPYIIFSLAYFLNLEGVLHFLKLGNYHTVIFHPRFVAVLFALVLLYLFRQLWLENVKTKTPTAPPA
jgi:Gpi18-like mannosyltransferase